jgi:hypothetical protein
LSEYRTDEAFAIVPMWLIESKVSDRALRLYALLSGMRDYGTDMATVGRKLLASKLGCSDDTLDRAKAELEKVKAISVERGQAEDGQIARNVYTIHRVSPGTRNGAGRVAAPVRVGGTDAARLPFMDESSSSSSETKKAKPTSRLPKTVGGQKVTEAEHDLVDALLARFNERAGGKSFSGKEWREAIVRRLREHSGMAADEHLGLIDRQFARPWWKGDATPSVIWGNGRVFDRAVNGAQGPQAEEDRFTRD